MPDCLFQLHFKSRSVNSSTGVGVPRARAILLEEQYTLPPGLAGAKPPPPPPSLHLGTSATPKEAQRATVDRSKHGNRRPKRPPLFLYIYTRAMRSAAAINPESGLPAHTQASNPSSCPPFHLWRCPRLLLPSFHSLPPLSFWSEDGGSAIKKTTQPLHHFSPVPQSVFPSPFHGL